VEHFSSSLSLCT